MKALVVILLLALVIELFIPVSAAKKTKKPRPSIKRCAKTACTNRGMCSRSCAGCYADSIGPRGIKYCQAG
uniref:Putative secreted protein n=1 Tax=Ornithodoros turicata TaxID=34597 RepID=A0A2R5LBC2_9ACAR